MVVVRPRCEDEIGVPQADLPNDVLARLQRRDQLAVVIVERDVFDAGPPARLTCFLTPPRGECAPAFGLVTGVAIGDRYEPHAMTELGQLDGRAAGALVAIVGMGAEGDDVQPAVRARRERSLRSGLLC